MVINAKTTFMKKLAATYKRALTEYGKDDADARIKHLNVVERGLIKLLSTKTR